MEGKGKDFRVTHATSGTYGRCRHLVQLITTMETKLSQARVSQGVDEASNTGGSGAAAGGRDMQASWRQSIRCKRERSLLTQKRASSSAGRS